MGADTAIIAAVVAITISLVNVAVVLTTEVRIRRRENARLRDIVHSWGPMTEAQEVKVLAAIKSAQARRGTLARPADDYVPIRPAPQPRGQSDA
jgi:hypothetical protein